MSAVDIVVIVSIGVYTFWLLGMLGLILYWGIHILKATRQ